MDGKETSTKDNKNDRKNVGEDKNKARSSSSSAMNFNGGKNASARDPGGLSHGQTRSEPRVVDNYSEQSRDKTTAGFLRRLFYPT